MSLYEKIFKQVLLEEEASRTDSTGGRVKVPLGYKYKEGDNGKGVAIPPSAKAKQDEVGKLHGVPTGHSLKVGKNGKGIVAPAGEPTTEDEKGQIKLRRKQRPKSLGNSAKISQGQLLKNLRSLAQ